VGSRVVEEGSDVSRIQKRSPFREASQKSEKPHP
jgi:hypothetical protein